MGRITTKLLEGLAECDSPVDELCTTCKDSNLPRRRIPQAVLCGLGSLRFNTNPYPYALDPDSGCGGVLHDLSWVSSLRVGKLALIAKLRNSGACGC